MISIQQTLSELEKTDQMRAVALDCYLTAIKNMAHYAVELEPAISLPHRQYLTALAGEVAAGTPAEWAESRSTLRGLLREYRDVASHYLSELRDQLAHTAEALQETVEALSQSDTDHGTQLRHSVKKIREVADSLPSDPVQSALLSATSAIEDSFQQMQKQHQLTVTQFQTEMRLLHHRIDSLETAAALDEASKFSNRRFLAEYLANLGGAETRFVFLKIFGLAGSRGKFGTAIADNLVATFGRRLRNIIPKEAVVGRWNDQDFLLLLPAGAPTDPALCRRVAEHLSTPYACMIAGKVVRIPLRITAEGANLPASTSEEEILARINAAFA